MQVFIFVFVAFSLCDHSIAADAAPTLTPSPTPSPIDSLSLTEVKAVCAPSTLPTRNPTPHPSVHPSPRSTGSHVENEGPSWILAMRSVYLPSTSNPISAFFPSGLKSELKGWRLAAIISWIYTKYLYIVHNIYLYIVHILYILVWIIFLLFVVCICRTMCMNEQTLVRFHNEERTQRVVR